MRTRLLALIVVALAVAGAGALTAQSAQARTYYLYRASFSPSIAEEGSGVTVRFFNVDSDVRTLCSQLRPLGGLLDALVRGITRANP